MTHPARSFLYSQRSTSDAFARLQSSAHEAATGQNSRPEPTPAQQIAGNYKKGRFTLHGLPLRIENVRNSVREGEAEGKAWSNRLAAHYGEIAGTVGNDGDPIDVFVGLFPESTKVWVINQRFTKAPNEFDEHKVMLGFMTLQQASEAYQLSFDREWNGLESIYPCSISQFKWWLQHGNKSLPFTPDQLPSEGKAIMDHVLTKVLWSNEALPITTQLPKLMYDLRVHDKEDGFLLDAVTMEELMGHPDIDEAVVLDALVIEVNRMTVKMELLKRVMEAAGSAVKPVNMTISDPVRARGVLQVMVLFEMSDGQTIAIWFHNPDTTPARLTPMDELISWKWMLNKKDVTIVVAPERGKDLNVREVARRVMRLVERNSDNFKKANVKAAERVAQTEAIKTEIVELESELATVTRKIEVARMGGAVPASAAPKVIAPEPEAATPGDGATDAAFAEAGVAPDVIAAMTDAGGYPAIMADEKLQLEWQDVLDSAFAERIIAVRNALRELGWTGKGESLQKTSAGFFYNIVHKTKNVGAGANVVGVTWDCDTSGAIVDDLTQLAAGMAARIDALVPVAAAPAAETAAEPAKVLATEVDVTKLFAAGAIAAAYALWKSDVSEGEEHDLTEFVNGWWDNHGQAELWKLSVKVVKGWTDEEYQAAYDALEDWNFHPEALVLMAKRLGNSGDVKEAMSILTGQRDAGSATSSIMTRRVSLGRKLRGEKVDTLAQQIEAKADEMGMFAETYSPQDGVIGIYLERGAVKGNLQQRNGGTTWNVVITSEDNPRSASNSDYLPLLMWFVEIANEPRKDAADPQAAVLAELVKLGWEDMGSGFVGKVIGGGFTGGTVNPGGDRRFIANFAQPSVLVAKFGDTTKATVMVGIGVDPAGPAKELDDQVNAMDPRQTPATGNNGTMNPNLDLSVYNDWERAVTDLIIEQGDMSNGDAQGIVETQPFVMQQQWGLGSDPATAAAAVLAAALVKSPEGEVPVSAELVAAGSEPHQVDPAPLANGDISYSAGDMFTTFLPDSKAGEEAWKIINATEGSEGGKVFNQHAESVIAQLRAAGYVVNPAAPFTGSTDELAAALAEPSLPVGWTESTPGGLATNRDPINGGIVDKQMVSGEWFFIPENEAVTKMEGFATRDEAFAALAQAVATATAADTRAAVDLSPAAEAPVDPAALEAQKLAEIASAADVAYLNSLIDGSADLFATDIMDKLEPMFAKYEADPAMMELLTKATNAYSDNAVAAARTAMAG